jgi:hypothetical protein
VSLLLKNELRLRIGARHCAAEIWRAGLVGRCVARVMVQDDIHDLIEAALAALEARGTSLPARAVLSVEDELLYFATLPASGPFSAALAAAQEHFSSALGEHELLVGVTLLATGRRWLASALPAELLETWRLTLSGHDIATEVVQPAVLQDLRALGATARMDDGLLVMVRAEGMSFLSVDRAGITDLGWERRDLADLPGLALRVQALLAQRSAALHPPGTARPTVLLAPLNNAQAASLRPLAEAHGWRLSPPVLATTD